MKKALLILVLLLIPLSLFRLLFGLDLDEKSMKRVEERKQSQAVEDRDRQLISEFQAVAIPESFNGPEVWVPPIPTSAESQAVVPQTSSQDKSIVVADTQKEMEPSTSAVARVLKPLSTGNRIDICQLPWYFGQLFGTDFKSDNYRPDYDSVRYVIALGICVFEGAKPGLLGVTSTVESFAGLLVGFPRSLG